MTAPPPDPPWPAGPGPPFHFLFPLSPSTVIAISLQAISQVPCSPNPPIYPLVPWGRSCDSTNSSGNQNSFTESQCPEPEQGTPLCAEEPPGLQIHWIHAPRMRLQERASLFTSSPGDLDVGGTGSFLQDFLTQCSRGGVCWKDCLEVCLCMRRPGHSSSSGMGPLSSCSAVRCGNVQCFSVKREISGCSWENGSGQHGQQ